MTSPQGVLRSWICVGLAGLVEIGGVWSIWQGVQEGRGPLWLTIGMLLLILGGLLTALADRRRSGTTLVAYGGVFLVGSLTWAILVDGMRPDRWDIAGAVICLAGVSVILYGRRRAR